jgi:hypothetical protein
MSRATKALLAIILIAVWFTPAWGAPPVALPAPVPPGVAPLWTPVPASPGVLYAPNAPGDIFRVHNKYYYYYGGTWYRSKHLLGGWKPVKKLPRPMAMVPRHFFKSPPPW